MTPEQLAALKAGASIQDVLAMSAESDPEVILAAAAQMAEQTESSAGSTANAGGAGGAGEDGEAVPAVTANAEIASLKAVNAEQATELENLKAQLAEAQGLAANAQTLSDELKALQNAHASTMATVNAMAAPLKAYATKMGVALSKPVDLEGKSPAEVLAAHAELSAGYAQAFVSGRKSAPAASAASEASEKKPSWLATASTLNF